MRVAFLVIVLVAGCGEKRNPDKCLDGHCPDPAKPFCDEGGEIGGDPGACVAVECTPGEFGACRDDRALMCNSTGDNYDMLECMLGCSEFSNGCNKCEDLASCGPETHIVPKYLPTVCDQTSGSVVLDVSSMQTIDTSIDAMCNGGIVTQVGGPEICVVRYNSVLVRGGQTLRIKGSRTAALVADNSITIDGIIDASADGATNGPGGGSVRSGGTSTTLNGDGGAGFGSAGGSGALAGQIGLAFNAGPKRDDPDMANVFLGGAKATAALGGGGGGALALISCRASVVVLGLIDAGGGGGAGGITVINEIPAGGGGSGGYVVLQGWMVSVTGEIYANGGGGGAGRDTTGPGGGESGSDGSRSAIGGGAAGMAQGGAGNGGPGSCINFGPDGAHGSSSTGTNGAGAGGGGGGYIQFYTPPTATPIPSYISISPPPQPNRTITTR